MFLKPSKNTGKDCKQEACEPLRQLLLEIEMDPKSADAVNKIREKIDLLEKENGMIKDELSISMHDLNNSLSIFMGIMNCYENEIDKEDLSLMEEGLSKIINITRKMVAMCSKNPNSTVENGTWLEMINLSDFIEKNIMPFKRMHNNIEFCVDVDSNHSIRIAQQSLGQSIENLLLNSIKAIGGKMGKIVISANQLFIENGQMPKGMYTSITIEDNGCGIDESNICNIFEPFFTTDSENGMGIGLRSVQKTVDQHSGYIFVDSSTQANSFTRFTIFLPMPGKEFSEQKKSSIPPEPILMINQDPTTSQLLSKSLSCFGGNCKISDSTGDTIFLIDNAPQSGAIIISNDISESEHYVIELIKLINNRRPDLNIFLSTKETHMDIETLKEDGVICEQFQRPFINPLIKGLSQL